MIIDDFFTEVTMIYLYLDIDISILEIANEIYVIANWASYSLQVMIEISKQLHGATIKSLT